MREKKWNRKKDDDDSDFEVVDSSLEKSIRKASEKSNNTSDGENSDQEAKDTRKLLTQHNRKKKTSGGFQSKGFQSMGLSHSVYKGISRKGYKIPTPIQRKTIPLLIEGKDVVAMARTGTKTGARALILSPTRELALQTLKFTKELGKFTGLKAAVILGGDRMDDQFAALHENPDIIIATPGRLLHVLVEMNLKLRTIEYIVFDEADRLFEMGFQEQMTEILHRVPETRQTLLFSATLPKLLVEFAKAGLHDPILIRLDVETKISENLKMSFFGCREDDKASVLIHLLKNIIDQSEQTVVFAATKHHVEYLNMLLQKAGIDSTYIYSSLDQTARKIAVGKFVNKKSSVMIVTDIAARGIDIPLLDNVINYNFPAKGKLFVHRVGRVARAGRSGMAYSLVSLDEMPYLLDLCVFLGRSLKVVPLDKKVTDDDGFYGLVPQDVIDDMAEKTRIWHTEMAELESMKKVVENALNKYIKSRQAPAAESIKRYKEMNKSGVKPGVHPVFGDYDSIKEDGRLQLLNALKSYKANTTIFEVNATSKTKAFGVMKKKRGYHQGVIKQQVNRLVGETTPAYRETLHKQDAADEDDLTNTFNVVIGKKRPGQTTVDSSTKKRKVEIRDEENYLHYTPSDFDTESRLGIGTTFEQQAAGVSMDITGDEDNTLQKTKSAFRWDRKKKKFVKDGGLDPKKKKIRTESGALISASFKSTAYEEWKNKTKVDDQDNQNDEDDSDHERKPALPQKPSERFTVLGTKRRRWHTQGMEESNQQKSGGGKKRKFKSELKGKEQILKQRNIKEKKQAYQSYRHHSNQKRSIFKSKKNK
ncbi:DDX54 [Mytilus coruscus]|uniref:RNA helicase n=1 Tax=Mytilus coruscus TaxID=42192 RepID=A0A6J8B828_MYTCO|nr:DDX54 [Mytilus coruscus]